MRISSLIRILLVVWVASAAQSTFARDYYATASHALQQCQNWSTTVENFSNCQDAGDSNNVCGVGSLSCVRGNTTDPFSSNPRWYYFTPSQSSLCDFYSTSGLCYEASGYDNCLESEWDELGNHCVTGEPYDDSGLNQDGFDENGCDSEGLCPGDPGYEDSDGYDSFGFDSSGQDRCGLTINQGGGYGGICDSTNPPPSWFDGSGSTDGTDFQNGDNQNSNGQYLCHRAYPFTIAKAALPASVIDGLGACVNDCSYQPSGSAFDFDTGQEVYTFLPTGYTCNGEPVITANLAQWQDPGEEEPTNDIYNYCYIVNGIFLCNFPGDQEPTCWGATATGEIIESMQLPCSGSSPSDPDIGDETKYCGFTNGIFHCWESDQNCYSFQGSIQCIDPDGNVIVQDDPDHIINGGNADGNSNNDVFESPTDVQNNGQSTQDRISNMLSAQEIGRQVAKHLTPELRKLNGNQSDDMEGEFPDYEALAESDEADIADAIHGVGDDSDLTFSEEIFDDFNPLSGLFPSASACQVFEFPILPDYGFALSIDTCLLDTIRLIMEYFFYVATAITLYSIALSYKEVT